MGTTAQKGAYLNVTKQKLKQAINNIGGEVTDETTFRNYVAELENAYDRLPKTEFEEGESVTLENCLKGKLDFDNGVVGIGQIEQAILPSEYQQVEYIEGTGTQFLMTNTYINNNNISIKTKITTPNMPSVEQDIVGNQDNTTGRFILGLSVNKVFLYSKYSGTADINAWSGEYSGEQTLEIETIFNQSTNTKTLKVNGTSYSETYIKSISNSNNAVQVFSNGNGESRFIGKVYYLKLYKGDTLSLDLYPCYRISDNVIGMYDLVTGTFYTNSGTGTFTKGADAPTPNAEIPIKCVTGNQNVVVRGKNVYIPTLKVEQTDINQARCDVSLDGDEYSLTATGQDMYFGEVTSIGTTYTQRKGEKISVKDKSKLSFYLTNTLLYSNYITAYDENGVSLGYTAISSYKGVYNIPSGADFVTIRFGLANATTGTTYKTKVMLTFSDTEDTTYEPYITPITKQLSLGDIELCGIGDHKDYIYKNDGKWYAHKEIVKINLADGQASQYGHSSGWENQTCFSITGLITHGISGYSTLADLFCNRLIAGRPDLIAYSQKGKIGLGTNNNIFFSIDGITTVQGYIDYFTANPTYLYAVPVQSTDTQITDTTLISQLEAWYNAHSNNGTSIITSNGNLPMIIKCRGLKGE